MISNQQSIMRRLCTALLVLAVLSIPAGAEPDPFIEANAAAAKGDHASAAAAFERSIDQDGWSVNALLGLANAYASTGDHGRAILALERARLLAPRDAAVASNLTRVREAAGVAAPPVSRVDRALGAVRSDTWAWSALAGFTLACGGLALVAWTRRRRLGATVAFIGGIATLATGLAATRVAPDPMTAVVLATETARIAPFAAAEAAFTAPAGELVEIVRWRDDHVYVRDEDRTGWLPAKLIERVVPRDRTAAGA